MFSFMFFSSGLFWGLDKIEKTRFFPFHDASWGVRNARKRARFGYKGS
jgi:hypothetical protein